MSMYRCECNDRWSSNSKPSNSHHLLEKQSPVAGKSKSPGGEKAWTAWRQNRAWPTWTLQIIYKKVMCYSYSVKTKTVINYLFNIHCVQDMMKSKQSHYYKKSVSTQYRTGRQAGKNCSCQGRHNMKIKLMPL